MSHNRPVINQQAQTAFELGTAEMYDIYRRTRLPATNPAHLEYNDACADHFERLVRARTGQITTSELKRILRMSEGAERYEYCRFIQNVIDNRKKATDALNKTL